jgi:hypothetical protein
MPIASRIRNLPAILLARHHTVRSRARGKTLVADLVEPAISSTSSTRASPRRAAGWIMGMAISLSVSMEGARDAGW